jgi:hypothetical protein
VNFGPADISGLKTNDKYTLHFTPSPATISFLKPLQFPDRFISGDGFRFRNLLKNFKYQQTHSPGTLNIIGSSFQTNENILVEYTSKTFSKLVIYI